MTDQQKKKIYQSITEIDDRFVEEAAEESVAEIRVEVSQEDQGTAAGPQSAEKKTAKRLRILRMAMGLAAAAAVAAAGIVFLPKILPESLAKGSDLIAVILQILVAAGIIFITVRVFFREED